MWWNKKETMPIHTNFGRMYRWVEAEARFRAEKKESPEQIYGFFIDAMGREIEALYASGTFGVGVDALQLLRFPAECCEKEKPTQILCLTKENVATVPWSTTRLGDALVDVAQKGYQRARNGDMCHGQFYEALNLVVIDNAHHHAAAARAYRDAGIEVDVYVNAVEKLFCQLRITSDLYWADETGGCYKANRPDPRFALMYEFARRRALANRCEQNDFVDFLSEPELEIDMLDTTMLYPAQANCGLSVWKRKILSLLGVYEKDGGLYIAKNESAR